MQNETADENEFWLDPEAAAEGSADPRGPYRCGPPSGKPESRLAEDFEALTMAVSHDLRAPLRAIDGYLSLLGMDSAIASSLEARGHVDRARSALSSAVVLVSRLLQFVSIGKIELELERIDVTALAEQIVDQLRVVEPHRKIEVDVQRDMIAVGDRMLVRQLLQNLIGNAWKFTRETAGASVSVQVFGSGTKRVFRVRDNGCGFSMADARRLFLPFQRLHSSAQYPGSGIGLAMARRIVRLHGGAIWASGIKGQGAAFHFSLPAVSGVTS